MSNMIQTTLRDVSKVFDVDMPIQPTGWERHWEVLDRVGLPDFTPDLQWQTDVMRRAGMASPKLTARCTESPATPLASAAPSAAFTASSDGVAGNASVGGSSAATSRPALSVLTRPRSPSLPPTGTSNAISRPTSEAARFHAPANPLHPRNRPGPAPQPQNRRPPPRPLPQAVVNLQLFESAPNPYLPSLASPPHSPPQSMPLPPQLLLSDASASQLPHSTAAAAVLDSVVESPPSTPTAAGPAAAAVTALPNPRGSNPGCMQPNPPPPLATAEGAGQPTDSAAGGDGSSSGGGGGGAAAGGGGSSTRQAPGRTVSFGTALTLQTQAASSNQITPSGADSGAATDTAPTSTSGGGGVFVSRAVSASGGSLVPYRLAPSRGGSAALIASSRAMFAGNVYPPQSQMAMLAADFAAGSPRPAMVGPNPRERYKGIIERLGRSTAHRHRERRRVGAAPAASGLAGRRARLSGVNRSETGDKADSSSASSGDDRDGPNAGTRKVDGDGATAAAVNGSGLAAWGSKWREPLAGLNTAAAGATAATPATAVPSRTETTIGSLTSMLRSSETSTGVTSGSVRMQSAPASGRVGMSLSSLSRPGTLTAMTTVTTAVTVSSTAEAGGKTSTAAGLNEASGKLDPEERAVQQLRAALDELTRFSCRAAVGTAALSATSVLAQVDARINALQRADKIPLGPDGRRPSVLPPAPTVPFPAAAAVEYLAAARRDVAGVGELQTVVARVRNKLKVVLGNDTGNLAEAAAQALAEMGIGASEPTSVFTCSHCGASGFLEESSIPYQPPMPYQAPHALPPSPLRGYSGLGYNSGSSVAVGGSGFLNPPGLSATSLSYDDGIGHFVPSSPETTVSGAAPPAAAGSTSSLPPPAASPGTAGPYGNRALSRLLTLRGAWRDDSGGAASSGPSFANAPPPLHLSTHSYSGAPALHPPSFSRANGPSRQTSVSRAPRTSSTYRNPTSARVSISGTGAGTGTGTGAGAAAPPAVWHGSEQAWGLLEALVMRLHESHAMRLEVKLPHEPSSAKASSVAEEAAVAAAASKYAAVQARDLVMMPPTDSINSANSGHGSGAIDPKTAAALRKAAAAAAAAEAAAEAAAAAAVDRNSAMAAVLSAIQPGNSEQAMYFLSQLALMLQRDPHLPPDAGFLLAAGVDLLLGEVGWLLAAVSAGTGPASPHLAAVAALLAAYESQSAALSTLRCVAERLELAMEDAMDRATLAERQVASLHTQLQRAGHDVRDSEVAVREAEREAAKLRARNEFLEELVAELEGDLGRVEAAHYAREVAVERGGALSAAMWAEQMARVAERSKEVQVATEGDCSDPQALPPALRANARHYYPVTPSASKRGRKSKHSALNTTTSMPTTASTASTNFSAVAAAAAAALSSYSRAPSEAAPSSPRSTVSVRSSHSPLRVTLAVPVTDDEGGNGMPMGPFTGTAAAAVALGAAAVMPGSSGMGKLKRRSTSPGKPTGRRNTKDGGERGGSGRRKSKSSHAKAGRRSKSPNRVGITLAAAGEARTEAAAAVPVAGREGRDGDGGALVGFGSELRDMGEGGGGGSGAGGEREGRGRRSDIGRTVSWGATQFPHLPSVFGMAWVEGEEEEEEEMGRQEETEMEQTTEEGKEGEGEGEREREEEGKEEG